MLFLYCTNNNMENREHFPDRKNLIDWLFFLWTNPNETIWCSTLLISGLSIFKFQSLSRERDSKARRQNSRDLHLALFLLIFQIVFWAPMNILAILMNARFTSPYLYDASVMAFLLSQCLLIIDAIVYLMFMRKLREEMVARYRMRIAEVSRSLSRAWLLLYTRATPSQKVGVQTWLLGNDCEEEDQSPRLTPQTHHPQRRPVLQDLLRLLKDFIFGDAAPCQQLDRNMIYPIIGNDRDVALVRIQEGEQGKSDDGARLINGTCFKKRKLRMIN